MNQPSSFRRYLGDLEAELRSVLGNNSSPLYTMMRYHLGWVDAQGEDQPSPGKMSRPTLCLLACEATGGDWRSALPAAAAVELIHNFSLIHDDIQDGSWERRHRPTVWKVWGEAQAINAGDAMYVLAQLALFRLNQKSTPLPKIILLSTRLNQASLQLCEGQYLDIEFERHLDITVDQYLDMIDKKTAALFAASLYFGALLGTDRQNQVRLLSSFGRNLGMAYQVQNDLQGIWGEEENGKAAPYTDIRSKKKTLPIVYALHTVAREDREALLEIYGKQRITTANVARVVRILDRINARAFAERMRDSFYRKCLKNLDKALPHSPAKRQLGEVAAYLMGKGNDS
ncbi:MAG: polyprenyl synthetase family protein [Dehalococcoidia bacterium]|nr:polyprenyl synthetase family protein [Dehalococcoidia bacterium]